MLYQGRPWDARDGPCPYLIGSLPVSLEQINEEKAKRLTSRAHDRYIALPDHRTQEIDMNYWRATAYGTKEDVEQQRIDAVKASMEEHKQKIARLEGEVAAAEETHKQRLKKYGGPESIAQGAEVIRKLKEFEQHLVLERNNWPGMDEEGDEEDGLFVGKDEKSPEPFVRDAAASSPQPKSETKEEVKEEPEAEVKEEPEAEVKEEPAAEIKEEPAIEAEPEAKRPKLEPDVKKESKDEDEA